MIEKMRKYPIISNPMPVSGIISIEFTYTGDRANAIYIADVELFSSGMSYVGLKVNLSSPNLVTMPQESIIDIPSRHYPWFQTDIKSSDAPSLFDYFNIDNSPNIQLLR